ncbi:MAG: hypothetical protein ACSHXI_06920 [Hoeflea sp.]|uniref:hypothetical protein n=1 Tax=Hoeflea sp. TaxID=1940281 RepID=UPI003EF5B502
MFGLTTEDATNIGTFIGAVVIAVIAYLGRQWGKRRVPPAEQSIEVAGAIVDASSVNNLARAIDRLASFGDDYLESEKRSRDLGHKGVDAVDRLTAEMRELRTEIRHFGDNVRK